MTPRHLQFVNRLSGDPRSQQLKQSLECVMISLEPSHNFFNTQPRLGGIFHRAHARDCREVFVRLVFHRFSLHRDYTVIARPPRRWIAIRRLWAKLPAYTHEGTEITHRRGATILSPDIT